jgi:hypothetical protein
MYAKLALPSLKKQVVQQWKTANANRYPQWR